MKELINKYRENKEQLTIKQQIKVVEYQLSILNPNGTKLVKERYKSYQVELLNLYKRLLEELDFNSQNYQNIRIELFNHMENIYYNHYMLVRGIDGKSIREEFESLVKKVKSSKKEVLSPCSKCGGTGILKHYMHHDNGICFKCKGTGKHI